MIPILIQSSLLAVSAVSSVYASPLSTSPFHPPSGHVSLTLAPILDAFHPHGTINNSYIVALKSDVTSALITNHFNFLDAVHASDPLEHELSGIQNVYTGHLKGYAGWFSDSVIEQVRSMPEVAYIERNQVVRTTDIQRMAPWGLARVSHRKALSLSTFNKYEFDGDGGEGVDVYVIDTGINIKHVEFEGRAQWGHTVPANDVDEDGNGHGTHCAGTIASKKYGVAKKATVIAVKVLGSNGSGSMADVVAGVDWAAQQALAKKVAAEAEYKATGKTKHKGSVSNMSLGGGKSDALDQIVNAAVDSGMHFAVAAGNDNADACNSSPARADKAVTVGASTISDERAYFSNHGPCVNVFAPGLNILSTWNTGPRSSNTISGTSMASPHVAGLLAYLLSIYPSKTFDPIFEKDLFTSSPAAQQAFSFYTVAHASLPAFITRFLPSPSLIDVVVAPVPSDPLPSPKQLKDALVKLSTSGILTDLPPKTVNLLVFNNFTKS